MQVQGMKCHRCGDTIYSRADHDFRRCTCGKVAVDGGLSYLRVLWFGDQEGMEQVTVEVDATAHELYDDWAHSRNKYGMIRALYVPESIKAE